MKRLVILGLLCAQALQAAETPLTNAALQGTLRLDVSSAVIGTGGSLTTSDPLNFTQTWNAGGVTFGAIKLTITDTASAAASLPFQILGGAAGTTNLFKVDKSGNVTAVAFIGDGSGLTGLASTWDTLGDPTGDATIDFGTTNQTITSDLDSGRVLEIDNTHADISADTPLLKLSFADASDVNALYLLCMGGKGTTNTLDYQLRQDGAYFMPPLQVSGTVTLGDGNGVSATLASNLLGSPDPSITFTNNLITIPQLRVTGTLSLGTGAASLGTSSQLIPVTVPATVTSASTTGATVTGTGVGTDFAPASVMVLEGVAYKVDSVTNANEVVLATAPPALTAVQPYTLTNGNLFQITDPEAAGNLLMAFSGSGQFLVESIADVNVGIFRSLNAGSPSSAVLRAEASNGGFTGNLFHALKTSTDAGLSVAQDGVTTIRHGTLEDAIKLSGRAGGVGTFAATVLPGTLAGNITLTLPTSTGTVALTSDITGGGLAGYFSSIELSHATQNTLTASAGVLSIEGKTVLDQTNTLSGITNKTFSGAVLSGGTIDNAPIGATTRSTGAFTTLAANSTTTVTDNTFTTGNLAAISSTSMTTGSLLDLTSAGTAAAAGNKGLNIALSGATATNAITTTGATISNTHTNATSGTNIALTLTASGATTANTALNVTAGQALFAAGSASAPMLARSADPDDGIEIGETTIFYRDGIYAAGISTSGGLGQITFGAASVAAPTAAQIVAFLVEAPQIWAQRSATNAQTHRIYNTYTSTTNYERGKLEWSSNIFNIGTEKGSGGGTARAMALQTDGITAITINTDQTIAQVGKTTTYNNIATVSNGIPAERATVDLTAQVAAVSATTIYTPAASGMFRISIVLQVTTAATVSSVPGGATGVTITYTEPDGSVAQSIKPLLTSEAGAVIVPATGNAGNATTTQSQGTAIIYAKTGVAIQYAIGYTNGGGGVDMAYSAHLKVEAL